MLAVAAGDSIKILRTEHTLAERKQEQSQYEVRSKQMHEQGCCLLKFNVYGGYGLSIGGDGVPELWDPETLEAPKQHPLLTETDLYELCEHKVVACEFSETRMAVLTAENKLMIFDEKTLKLVKTFNESLENFLRV